MKLKNAWLIALLLSLVSIALVDCSSCSGPEHQRTIAPIPDVAEGSVEVVEDISEEADGSGDATGVEEDSDEICPLGNSSRCFVDRDLEEVLGNATCIDGTTSPVEITESLISAFADSERRMYMCPGFQGAEDSQPYGLILVSLANRVFFVSEIHSFEDVGDLATAMLALVALYDNSCSRTDIAVGMGDTFTCQVNNRSVFVSIAGSSEDDTHSMVINFISDPKAFGDTLALFEE